MNSTMHGVDFAYTRQELGQPELKALDYVKHGDKARHNILYAGGE
jgi:hypothetical protein